MSKEFVKWLVPLRSQLQDDLLSLRNSLRRLPRQETHTSESRMAAWLLGAGFSLWRAVFLADVSLAPDKNMQDAEAFLDRVLLDHTIVYRDDKNSWSFGYYINNARFRLKQAAKELKDSERMDKLDGELRILKDGLKGADMGAREAYENVHKVMHILTGLLAKRLV